MKKMIFFYPAHLKWSEKFASSIRPLRLRKAFENAGYVPQVISGGIDERRSKLSGIDFSEVEFAYGENLTVPLFLADGKKYFWENFLFWSDFFYILRRKNIPCGIFVRDVHWLFPELMSINYNFLERLLIKPFYILEYYLYYLYLDRIFVPSLKMAEEIPGYEIFQRKFVELPPGADSEFLSLTYSHGNLDVIYMGGLIGHYDMPVVAELIKEKMDGINWHFFVREEEWKSFSAKYNIYADSRVKVYFLDRDGIKKRLVSLSPLLLYFPAPFSYNKFARSGKVMDAVSWGIPVILPSFHGDAEFVREKGAGWVIPYDKERLKNLLIFLRDHPEELRRVSERLKRVAEEESWERRAEFVVRTLLG